MGDNQWLKLSWAVSTSEHFPPASSLETPYWGLYCTTDDRWKNKNTRLPEGHANTAVIFFLFAVLCHVECTQTFVLVSAAKSLGSQSTFTPHDSKNPLRHGFRSCSATSPSQLLNDKRSSYTFTFLLLFQVFRSIKRWFVWVFWAALRMLILRFRPITPNLAETHEVQAVPSVTIGLRWKGLNPFAMNCIWQIG